MIKIFLDYMSENNKIHEQEKEYYYYALKQFNEYIIYFVLIILYGLMSNLLLACILYLFTMSSKKIFGGSHAPNHFLCLVITYTHFLLTINLSKNIMIDHFIIICSFALSIIMIICFAPTDHKNKRLSCYQKRKLKKLSIHFCFIITVLFVLFMKNKQSHYISIIWFCIASLSFDLLISVIINKKGGNTHEL